MKDFIEKLTLKAQRFMAGRYGSDELTIFLLGAALFFYIISIILRNDLWTSSISFMLLGYAYFRILSKNYSKRRLENKKYLTYYYPTRAKSQKAVSRLKGMRTHKYFKCSECKQTLRVPKGKGNITVTCPKCKNQMHKKT